MESEKKESRMVPTESVYIHPANVRIWRDPETIQDRMESITRVGVLDPLLVVHEKTEEGEWGCISGGFRLEAAKRLGLKEVPVRTVKGSPTQLMTLSYHSNKENPLNPIEEAEFFKKLLEDKEQYPNYTAIVEKQGVSKPKIMKRLRLLELPEETKEMVRTGDLSVIVAEILAKEKPEIREQVYPVLRKRGRRMTSPMLRILLREIKGKKPPRNFVGLILSPEEKGKIDEAAERNKMKVYEYCQYLIRTHPESPLREVKVDEE